MYFHDYLNRDSREFNSVMGKVTGASVHLRVGRSRARREMNYHSLVRT